MQEEYNHSKDEAKKFASEAFSRIDREGLPSTPDIFELFYAYYSQSNSEVVRSIDIMVSQKFDLTLDRCRELNKRHLNSDKDSETLAMAEKIVGETLLDVGEMFDSVKTSNKDVSGSMKSINNNISNAIEPDQLKNIILSIMTEAQKMMSENQSLEKKLLNSSSKMQELKNEIEAVREEAFTDSLTRIPNRKKFDLESVRLVAESNENNDPLSIIFMDIDHFKSFNDAYGHQIGDQVLRLVSRSLRESLKGQDFACRYGGEEFVIMLPKTSTDGAAKIADILRETIKSKEIRNRKTGEVLTRVTISAGVTELRNDDEIQTWIDRADKALYQAKRKGRDCVVIAE